MTFHERFATTTIRLLFCLSCLIFLGTAEATVQPIDIGADPEPIEIEPDGLRAALGALRSTDPEPIEIEPDGLRSTDPEPIEIEPDGLRVALGALRSTDPEPIEIEPDGLRARRGSR